MEISPANVPVNGPLIRRRRQCAGLNVSQLAERASISVTYLSQIERGDRPRVSPRVFVQLCDGLSVSEADRSQLVAVNQ